MTNENAYKTLLDMTKGFGGNTTKFVALMTAIKSLKRRIPMKPKQDKRKGAECYCPQCGGYVGVPWDLCNFCSDCGQQIRDDNDKNSEYGDYFFVCEHDLESVCLLIRQALYTLETILESGKNPTVDKFTVIIKDDPTNPKFKYTIAWRVSLRKE